MGVTHLPLPLHFLCLLSSSLPPSLISFLSRRLLMLRPAASFSWLIQVLLTLFSSFFFAFFSLLALSFLFANLP